jgi:hypothetical protein
LAKTFSDYEKQQENKGKTVKYGTKDHEQNKIRVCLAQIARMGLPVPKLRELFALHQTFARAKARVRPL